MVGVRARRRRGSSRAARSTSSSAARCTSSSSGAARRDPIWPVDIFLPQEGAGADDPGPPARGCHRRLPCPVLPAVPAAGARERRAGRLRLRRSCRTRSSRASGTSLGDEAPVLDALPPAGRRSRRRAYATETSKETRRMELFPADKIVGVFRGFQRRRPGVPRRPRAALPPRLPEHPHARAVPARAARNAGGGGARPHHLALVGGQARRTAPARSSTSGPCARDGPFRRTCASNTCKYRVNIRVLGVLRNRRTATARLRRLAPPPAPRRKPGRLPVRTRCCKEIAGHNVDGAAIGHLRARRVHLCRAEPRRTHAGPGCRSRSRRSRSSSRSRAWSPAASSSSPGPGSASRT